MTFISYSQNFEDVMLWRALKDVDPGFYIDVGANDPNRDSVTKAFYDRGWCGINLEPVEHYFDILQMSRPRDINLKVAAGSEQGLLQFYEFPDTGLSTLNKSIAERHESERDYKKIERTVQVATLSEICRTYPTDLIHFMNIDVEGAEKQVLEGVDFTRIRPWIILVESTLPNSQVDEYRRWEPILLKAGYEFAYFDGLNRFYVAKEQYQIKNCFKAPPNYFDGFTLSGNSSSSFCSHVLNQSNLVQTALTEAQIEIDRLTCKLEEKRKALSTHVEALSKQKAHVRWLNNKMDNAKIRTDELNQTLIAIRRSTSWRVTKPLRKMSNIAKGQLSRPIQLTRNIIQLLKRAALRTLAMATTLLLKSNALRVGAKALLQNYPGLKERLLQSAQVNGPIVTEKANSQSVDADLTSLTPIAHGIYEDLKTAMALRPKENE